MVVRTSGAGEEVSTACLDEAEIVRRGGSE